MDNYQTELVDTLNLKLKALEDHFHANILLFYGSIVPWNVLKIRKLLEQLAISKQKKNVIYIILQTPGGSAETVERLVQIIRFHFQEVNFIIPDSAYSAGTIFCLSGDNILMNYSSCLGPIDPQVYNGKDWVPAMGYLDKVEEFINKSKLGIISPLESILMADQDLALLRKHEQARDLTVALIKDWLVKYKFKNWNETEHSKLQVTLEYKTHRAEEIAKKLGDNKIWHSHSRPIGINSLRENLGLKIDDFSKDNVRFPLIMDYYELSCSYILKSKANWCFHTNLDIQLYS